MFIKRKKDNSIPTNSENRTSSNDNIHSYLLESLISALTNTINTSSTNIKNPTDYMSQVARCRDIYGGQYSDPLVTTILDTTVAAIVSYGSSIMFRGDVESDHDAREILIHWIHNINSGRPLLTSGLDYVRQQLHKLRYRDGGAVLAWSVPEKMVTENNKQYIAPRYFAVYPRTMFNIVSSDKFGELKLEFKSDLVPIEEGTTATDRDAFVRMNNDFISQNRYHVFDRNRIESVEAFPTPFLIERGVHIVCERIRTMQRGDYQTSRRIIRAILLLTKGNDRWLDLFEKIPTAEDFRDIVQALSSDDNSYTNIIGSDYTTNARFVVPDMQALISPDKFNHDDFERLAGLGIIEITGTGQRRRYMYNPKPFILELQSSIQADRRLVQDIIFPLLWESNKDIFSGIKIASFMPKPATAFWETEERAVLQKMFEYGLLTYGSWLEMATGYGADIEAEANRRKVEKEQGYDELFEPRATFTQAVRRSAPPAEAILKAKRNTSDIEDRFDEMESEAVEIMKSDIDEESKKRYLRFLILATLSSINFDLANRLKNYYIEQFPDGMRETVRFNKFLEKIEDHMQQLGSDILNGSKGGTLGLYNILNTPKDKMESAVSDLFSKYKHRFVLNTMEPFKYAEWSAKAAMAMEDGKKYAQRHSAFSDTTCEECIRLHGEIRPIEYIFEGDWDHPHGKCWWEFLTSSPNE